MRLQLLTVLLLLWQKRPVNSKDIITCIPDERGIFVARGQHSMNRIQVEATCPLESPFVLRELCSPLKPDNSSAIARIQADFHERIRANMPLKEEHKLELQRVTPVIDNATDTAYSNVFCALCHKGPSVLDLLYVSPIKLKCGWLDNQPQTICHVAVDSWEFRGCCERYSSMSLDWGDLLFVNPGKFKLTPNDFADFSKYSGDASTTGDAVYDAIVWAVSAFSLVLLVVCIFMLVQSSHSKRSMANLMAIALCSALLGTVIVFMTINITSSFVSAESTRFRPMFVGFGFLLQYVLLVSFMFMSIFAVELWISFGVFGMLKRCIRGRTGDDDATTAAVSLCYVFML